MFGYTLPGFIADAVLACIVIAGFFIGINRGFIKTVAKPVKFFASLAIAFRFCAPAGAKYIQPYIQSPIQNHLSEYLTEKCTELTAANVGDELPTLLKIAAALFKIDVQGVADAAGTEGLIQALVDNLTTPLISLVSMIAAFVILYFLSKLVFSIIVAIIDRMAQGGVIGAANKILGCIFGVLFAGILAWLLVCVSDFVFSLETLNDKEVILQIEQGHLYQLLRTYNPFDLLLSF
ncbi:MAG: CvpA family protein [Clostridia bacterium]|nr:CvpA family protein [Clostridia bacterium]